MTTSILWFRRDLRLADHPALCAAVASSDRVVPLFVLDPALLRPAGANRVAFLLGALADLRTRTGGALRVVTGDPVEVVPRLAAGRTVHVSSDHGPYGRARDAAVAARVPLVATGSPYGVTPGRLRKGDGSAYRVFTPFHKAWVSHGIRRPAAEPGQIPWYDGDLATEDLPVPPASVPLPEPTEAAAQARWAEFEVDRYDETRNSAEGTSRLSPYLRWGLLHPRTLHAGLGPSAGAQAFGRELVWRDFYADVLWHHPRSAREDLQPLGIEHDEPGLLLEAWEQGRTGFPYVDAGMRHRSPRDGCPTAPGWSWRASSPRTCTSRGGAAHGTSCATSWTATSRATSTGGSGSRARARTRRRTTGCSTRCSRARRTTRTATTCAAGCPSSPTCRQGRSTSRGRANAFPTATRRAWSTTRSSGRRRWPATRPPARWEGDGVHSVSIRPAAGDPRAVALVLHGGKEHSYAPVSPRDLSPLRMVPFAKDLHRRGAAHGLAVWQLTYAVRGWNGEHKSPVGDARRALDAVRSELGDIPVVLVGHSMGGRTAAHVLDDPSVTAMVGLAPWLPDEPVEEVAGKQVMLVHGERDRITSPKATLAWAERARQRGGDVTFARLAGAGHYLLRRVPLWTELTTGFALQSLGIPVELGPQASSVLGAPGGTVAV